MFLFLIPVSLLDRCVSLITSSHVPICASDQNTLGTGARHNRELIASPHDHELRNSHRKLERSTPTNATTGQGNSLRSKVMPLGPAPPTSPSATQVGPQGGLLSHGCACSRSDPCRTRSQARYVSQGRLTTTSSKRRLTFVLQR